MILFEQKYVIIFASVAASLFMVALKASENDKSAAIDEFVVEREQSQFDDLPPAENVLLATGYRTGSSFLGELFNQNEDVFYLFEPDHRFLTTKIRKDKKGMTKEVQEEWASFILDLFQCNFTNQLLFSDRVDFKGRINFSSRSQALKSLGNKLNLKEAEALCKERRRVIKTIKPADISVLLREADKRDVDLRIMLYFRDARPVFLSRVEANGIGDGNYFINIANYCTEKLRQLDYASEHLNLRSKLKTVTFESLAERPEIEAGDIYDFLKWELPKKLEKWIEKNTQDDKGERPFWCDAAAGAEFERQIDRANVTGSANRINTAPLLCEAALRDDPVCNDPDISDECFSVCRLEYLTCRQNCSSTSCESACLNVYADCTSSCPCGAECPAGCVDCPEHPFCEDECEDAQINNEGYKTCLNAAVFELDSCLKSCPPEIGCHNSCYEKYTQQLFSCPCIDQQTTTTTDVSTTTTTTAQMTPIAPSDVFILVIPDLIDGSYLQSGDGTSQISATINAPQNNYADYAAHALVNGELHIFGGVSDGNKIARLDGCSFNELPARLSEERDACHAAVSTENGQKALVCFGYTDDTRKSCEIFDGSSTAPTFAADWTHRYGGLGLFNNRPATVGCWDLNHRKAETLSATGWTALPDHPLRIAYHSLVGLDNGAMLLLGGYDFGSGSLHTRIWELKEEQWSRIGELSKPAYFGSAIYVSRSVYYFEYENSAIHRLDLDENEELEAVEEIARQPSDYLFPVLFQADSDYCT